MAFLKETERSLRAYFIVIGVLGTLVALSELGHASKASPIARSIVVTLATWFPPLAHLVLAPAFVVAGITLKRALERGAPRTKQLVKISAAVIAVECVLGVVVLNSLGAMQSSSELAGRAFGRALIPLLILWYVYASLRRLADESQRRIVDALGSKFD
ncbi:MAG TPA: hypothetical protein VK601_03980 [Kofleriaceae bacterium]|nr:hypothetical protein [Kofleriaceae bacterium]